ncbi:sterol-binding protein [Streptomyces sp. NPDC058045]|uniref:sterol-binding protein n=1 Tax=Streptomyces sp. NPDC058045 TaxID=3346311 RepID=UPI0036EC3989
MATIDRCRTALDQLADALTGAGTEVRTAASLDRSVSCHLTDLDLTFTGRLHGGRIEVLDEAPGPPADRAQIRLATSSDDLVAMVDGLLPFPRALAAGRVRLHAGPLDLLRLRKLL